MGYSLFILLFGVTSRCGGGRLCFAQSYLLRPCITWPVEVQNSDPVPMVA